MRPKRPRQPGPYPAGEGNRSRQYEWTGEFRPPKKGEWYLSGGPVEAWYAPNDFTTAYHIARPVQAPEEIEAHGYVYRRVRSQPKG